ncbi:MAG: hypothetical protein QQN62_03830 [Nitrosopumilus sp.]
MKLITTCFKHKLNLRNLEFKLCFVKNINNRFIDEIVIFFENYDDSLSTLTEFDYMRNNKVKIINVDSFPNYSVLFDYANENYKGEIVIVANADIYFDETLAKVENLKFKDNMMLFLTRYGIDNSGHEFLQNTGSFDSYIFRSPVQSFYNGIMMGVLGCDSYLLQRAIEAGMKVYNPALSVNSYHHHSCGGKSESRNGFRYWDQEYYKGFGRKYCKIEEIK